jgi:hypothetical protein
MTSGAVYNIEPQHGTKLQKNHQRRELDEMMMMMMMKKTRLLPGPHVPPLLGSEVHAETKVGQQHSLVVVQEHILAPSTIKM